jgi:hypothetical protein
MIVTFHFEHKKSTENFKAYTTSNIFILFKQTIKHKIKVKFSGLNFVDQIYVKFN